MSNKDVRWDYYTVTLNNTKKDNGISGGTITYSEVMCGDHLMPVEECGCLR
jgi:hypothetical protein